MNRNPKELAKRILEIEAVYSNDIQFSLTNLGLRLTFGETSLIQDEPPTHRIAVFIPAPIIEPFMTGLKNVMEQHAQNNAPPEKTN
jgi:hypothetical protein